MLVPMETDCILAQDERKPGGMWIEALQMARAPCMLCHPAARWLCPLWGLSRLLRQYKTGCGTIAPQNCVGLPKCAFFEGVVV